MQTNIVKLITKKFSFLKNIYTYVIIDNIVCVSCNDSEFDQDHFVNVKKLFFIDLKTFEIIRYFGYVDELGCPEWPIDITYTSVYLRYIIIEYEERTDIIFIDNFSVLSFGGTNYKIYKNFILFFPYNQYSVYDTFCIVDVQTKNRIDLHFILENMNTNFSIYDLESDFYIDFTEKYLKYKDKFIYKIHDLFQNKVQRKAIDFSHESLYNIQKLDGIWNGYALDIHTTKSTLMEDGSFDTIRSEIGELIYQIKYKYNKALIPKLSNIIAIKIKELYGINIDVIIPIPPSNLNRPYQPVLEISKEISKILSIPCDITYLQKKSTTAIKSIENYEERISVLKDAFFVRDTNYKDKTILLFDDLYRSGSTITTALKILNEEGKINNISVLTITKTRTKR